MELQTIRTLSAQSDREIICSYDCGKNAELACTYRLSNRQLCFYYYCHACWKASEFDKEFREIADNLDAMIDRTNVYVNAMDYQKASAVSLVTSRLEQARKDIYELIGEKL